MPTKQLLARLKCLHQCEESLATSDRDESDQATPNTIEFKQTPAWMTAYAQVKEILARREQTPVSKASRPTKRGAAARKTKSP